MYSKAFTFILISLALTFSAVKGKNIDGPQGASDDGFEGVALQPVNDLGRVTIEASNMPTTWQVAAAEALKTAYELQVNDEGRISLFISLFTEYYPEYQWNAVVSYQHLYYIANYYIRLRTDDGDVVFLFSSNS